MHQERAQAESIEALRRTPSFIETAHFSEAGRTVKPPS
jgi:hypothetical protein